MKTNGKEVPGYSIDVSAIIDDKVNHPAHYTQGGIECIEAIKASLTPEEFRGYCKGNAQKYLWRERHKNGTEDLKKAAWYLARLTDETYACKSHRVYQFRVFR